jgi:hypothetical protein
MGVQGYCMSGPPTLVGVVKDDTNGITLSRTQAADAVAEIDAIGASRALYGPVVNRKGHGISLVERHYLVMFKQIR